jgi:hypothetical protein
MKRYESKYAKCPFYHSEEQGKICCEGVGGKTSIHLAFEDSKEKRTYREEFCSEHYDKCLLCHMLYSKYDEEGNVK